MLSVTGIKRPNMNESGFTLKRLNYNPVIDLLNIPFKHCICRTTSKQFTAKPHVVMLYEFMNDAHTTAPNHNAP